jgi:glycosyltransferase involved in cell wall biosynthesis
MVNRPVISVVMVVCNVDRFLAESIESILGQTFHEFEFIIVDFGSIDKSKEIISSYAAKDSRIKLHEIPHCGLAEARNAGCVLARGQYIAIMDADDVSLPERLLWEVEFMEKHPKVGVVGGAVEWIDSLGKSLANPMPPPGVTLNPPVGNREIQSGLVKCNTLWQPSVLMRTEAFVLVGGYRGAFAPAEDYDLWLRISEHFEMANLKQVVLKYRIHPRQVSVRKHKQQSLSSLAAVASAASRRNGRLDPLDSVDDVTPAVLVGLGVSEAQQQSALAIGYTGWIRSMCGAGEWSAALNAATEMLKSSDWKYVERRVLADMRIEMAHLYWKNNRHFRSILTAGHAVMTRPIVAGRPLRQLLRRFGLV